MILEENLDEPKDDDDDYDEGEYLKMVMTEMGIS